MAKGLRAKKRELESIANQLETVARHAQRTALDPPCNGTVWLALLGITEPDKIIATDKAAPIWVFNLMRRYGKTCRDKAQAFGDLLRRYAPRHKRAVIDNLILQTWLLTGTYHDREIAFLLTNAFEAVGSKREFTEDQIKKHRQRYVVPRIEEYIRRNSPIPDPERLTRDSSDPSDSFPPVP